MALQLCLLAALVAGALAGKLTLLPDHIHTSTITYLSPDSFTLLYGSNLSFLKYCHGLDDLFAVTSGCDDFPPITNILNLKN